MFFKSIYKSKWSIIYTFVHVVYLFIIFDWLIIALYTLFINMRFSTDFNYYSWALMIKFIRTQIRAHILVPR